LTNGIIDYMTTNKPYEQSHPGTPEPSIHNRTDTARTV
jgi:hypothetical protein